MYTSEYIFQVHLTSLCNLDCAHCYMEKNTISNLEKYSIVEWLNDAIKTIESWKSTQNISFDVSIQFTGGEPFLYKDIEYVLKNVLSKQIFILSNGCYDINDYIHVLSLVKAVQLSCDGLENNNDLIRGVGTFEKILNTIEVLKRENKLHSINCTLLKPIIAEIKEYIQYLKNKGITRIGFKRYIPNSSNDCISITEYDFDRVMKELLTDNDLLIDDPLYRLYTQEDCGFSGCSAGFFMLCIFPNGDILPCSKIPIVIGNIYKDSFQDVWFNSDVLNKIRNRELYNSICKECNNWNECRGCRAYAFATENDILGFDKYCKK